MVGLTSAAGEGIRGSSRIDTTGNLLSPCSCNTPWLLYFMSHAPGSRRSRCSARAAGGSCGAGGAAAILPYPSKEGRDAR